MGKYGMNRQSAKEWLNKGWHHLSSGKILYEANHYTDTIAVDLHYAIEVILKSFFAYENKKIIKTDNLIELSAHLVDKISFNKDELKLMEIITTYHIRGSYPTRDRRMPPKEEIKEVLEFAKGLFDRVCETLEIDKSEVQE